MVVCGVTFHEFCHSSSSFLFTPGDAPIGRPTRKASKAIKALLNQIYQTEIGDQSDDPAHFVGSEHESNSDPQASSDDSEEEPVVPVPWPARAAKKKVKAKSVVDTSDFSDNHDGMNPISRHLFVAITYIFFGYRALSHHVRDSKST